MRTLYARPEITAHRIVKSLHTTDLTSSAIDLVTAGLAGVSSIDHATAYNFGIRGDGDLNGLCFRYWDPATQRFSKRFIRVKPDVVVDGRKYLQPVGECPRLYFLPGTSIEDLKDVTKPIFLTEGEKKTLALDLAARKVGIAALVLGVGGVWSWRHSPAELQPNGRLGKGKSRPIDDLDLVKWAGRKAYLFFDSDVVTNWKVTTAETALARELDRRGADVRMVRLPGGGSCRNSV